VVRRVEVGLLICSKRGLSDTEIAQFLLCTVPHEWQKRRNISISKMIAALTLVRQSESLKGLGIEERVRRALLVLS